ncbi:VOC family protein [Marinobacterium aestuariivivens]|uniref:VOC family protein n=1 Tax=Marinobacterium aestuariivivens TaxID=1698799 RepID=A0ABW2A3X1_9GAMM
MSIKGIEKLVFGVESLSESRRFLQDFGLTEQAGTDGGLLFTTLDGSEIRVYPRAAAPLPPAFEDGSTLRSVTWGVESAQALQSLAARLQDEPGFASSEDLVTCRDPGGMTLEFRLSTVSEIELEVPPINQHGDIRRINRASPVYERATPIGIGHVVFFVTDLARARAFYEQKLGFHLSDFYRGKGAFMRASEAGPHHHLFLLHIPGHAPGLNHVAFTVRDIHEVAGGGLAMNRKGWSTFLGPGRHPISSAYFWYVNSPLGGAFEYYSNDDYLTGEWQPRELEHSVASFTEWAVEGGIDPQTRRQHEAVGA